MARAYGQSPEDVRRWDERDLQDALYLLCEEAPLVDRAFYMAFCKRNGR